MVGRDDADQPSAHQVLGLPAENRGGDVVDVEDAVGVVGQDRTLGQQIEAPAHLVGQPCRADHRIGRLGHAPTDRRPPFGLKTDLAVQPSPAESDLRDCGKRQEVAVPGHAVGLVHQREALEGRHPRALREADHEVHRPVAGTLRHPHLGEEGAEVDPGGRPGRAPIGCRVGRDGDQSQLPQHGVAVLDGGQNQVDREVLQVHVERGRRAACLGRRDAGLGRLEVGAGQLEPDGLALLVGIDAPSIGELLDHVEPAAGHGTAVVVARGRGQGRPVTYVYPDRTPLHPAGELDVGGGVQHGVGDDLRDEQLRRLDKARQRPLPEHVADVAPSGPGAGGVRRQGEAAPCSRPASGHRAVIPSSSTAKVPRRPQTDLHGERAAVGSQPDGHRPDRYGAAVLPPGRFGPGHAVPGSGARPGGVAGSPRRRLARATGREHPCTDLLRRHRGAPPRLHPGSRGLGGRRERALGPGPDASLL